MKTTYERFEEKYIPEPNSGCWLWFGACSSKGYGSFRLGEMKVAHRVMWEWTNGPIPDGLQLDHKCRVRNCVNPAHLEIVTCRENVLRGEGAGRLARRTHCDNGHPLSGGNLYIRNDSGRRWPSRRCRTCTLAEKSRNLQKRKEKR